jgi:hypothetical protein
MKAIIITYTTENMNNTQKSIISKTINGYTDKSNQSKYTYQRKGLFQKIPHTKITDKTYIITENDYKKIQKTLKNLQINIKTWKINIKEI